MTDTIPETTPPPTKPGWKTTEFWLSLAAKLLGAAFAAGLIGDGTPLARVAGLAAVVLTSLGYTVNRAMVKAAGMLVLVGLLATPQLACEGARQKGAAAAGAFLDCEAPHLTPLLPDAVALAKAAVMRWISGAGTVDASGLKADAAPLKSDLGRCAFDAAVAALAAPAPARAPGAPAAAELAIDGGALRARWAQARAELGWPAERPPS